MSEKHPYSPSAQAEAGRAAAIAAGRLYSDDPGLWFAIGGHVLDRLVEDRHLDLDERQHAALDVWRGRAIEAEMKLARIKGQKPPARDVGPLVSRLDPIPTKSPALCRQAAYRARDLASTLDTAATGSREGWSDVEGLLRRVADVLGYTIERKGST